MLLMGSSKGLEGALVHNGCFGSYVSISLGFFSCKEDCFSIDFLDEFKFKHLDSYFSK